MMFSLNAAEGLVVNGGVICNAQVYGDIDIPLVIMQPEDSTVEKRTSSLGACL